MATKSKSKSKKAAAKKAAPKRPDAEVSDFDFDAALEKIRAGLPTPIEDRKKLLAQVAGSVAAGLAASPSPSILSPSAMATAAVDIAEEILKAAGISPTEVSAGTDAAPDGGYAAA